MSALRKPCHGFDHPAPPTWWWFAVWMIVGPIAIGGLLAAFTPLIVITAPVAAGLVVWIGAFGGFNASAFGALSGAGLGPLVVGCSFLGTNSGGSPLPWFVVAFVLFGAGIAGYLTVINAAPRAHPTDIRQ